MQMWKFKAATCLMFIGVTMSLGLTTCTAATSIAPTPRPALYAAPVLAGPVNKLNGVIRVEPKLSDDYFPNSGIGWQNGSDTSSAIGLSESITYIDRHEISWKVLNPANGVYNWLPLDDQIQLAVATGKQNSFRVYTMAGEGADGSMIPDWVLSEGASLLPSGEPDYSNCVYQEDWGKFVSELSRVYDGNSNIAFIDVSGYGDFNSWSWQDQQTDWDFDWQNGYANGSASPSLFKTLDGQARRRLADMYIGGSFDQHQCRSATGGISTIKYAYLGFQKTQLVMPYAGIVQSSQYVFSRRADVGFRYDCLGNGGEQVLSKVGNIILKDWVTAPVVFEFCEPANLDITDARVLLQAGHGSIVHDNTWSYGSDALKALLKNVGYRYFLKVATLQVADHTIALQMDWQNLGTAPNYPKMGQNFELYFYLIDSSGSIVRKELIPANVYQWLPLESSSTLPQVYPIPYILNLPFSFPAGKYFAGVGIIDVRTGKPINLAFGGLDLAGWHLLAPLEIK